MSTGGGDGVDGIEESWCEYVSSPPLFGLETVKVGVALSSQLALPLVDALDLFRFVMDHMTSLAPVLQNTNCIKEPVTVIYIY